MSTINTPRVVWAAVAAAVAFIVLEIVVEGLVGLIFRVTETELFVRSFGSIPTGARFHVVNVGVLFGICLLMMWLYAVLRARFGAGARSVFGTALFLWLFLLLLWVNFVNLGVFPLAIAGLSLLFNLVELPGAAIIGAAVYKEKEA